MREIKCRKHSHIHQVDFCPMCVHANLEAIHKLNRELNKKRSMSDYLTLIYLLFCVCVGGFLAWEWNHTHQPTVRHGHVEGKFVDEHVELRYVKPCRE